MEPPGRFLEACQVGYCQSMNFIAATLLMWLGTLIAYAAASVGPGRLPWRARSIHLPPTTPPYKALKGLIRPLKAC